MTRIKIFAKIIVVLKIKIKQMNRIIIGLVGETGSGKDTVANHLQEKYGVKLMRFADPLKDSLGTLFKKFSKEDQQWLSLKLRERFGGDVLCNALRKKVENAEGVVVINGMRMPEDYNFIKSFENSYILYITGDQKLRWQRVFNRGEKTDDHVDFEKFQEIEKAETEVHIPEIGAKADFTIKNDQGLEYLLKEADEVMLKIDK